MSIFNFEIKSKSTSDHMFNYTDLILKNFPLLVVDRIRVLLLGLDDNYIETASLFVDNFDDIFWC